PPHRRAPALEARTARSLLLAQRSQLSRARLLTHRPDRWRTALVLARCRGMGPGPGQVAAAAPTRGGRGVGAGACRPLKQVCFLVARRGGAGAASAGDRSSAVTT